jgi:hypothetical protein
MKYTQIPDDAILSIRKILLYNEATRVTPDGTVDRHVAIIMEIEYQILVQRKIHIGGGKYAHRHIIVNEGSFKTELDPTLESHIQGLAALYILKQMAANIIAEIYNKPQWRADSDDQSSSR